MKKRRSSATPRSVSVDLFARLQAEARDWRDVEVGHGGHGRDATGRTTAAPCILAGMLLGIDHLVIACADPDAAAAELERELGLRATGGGRHEALGTFNRLIWLGDTYLELIGVFDRELAERSWIGAPTVRALDAGGGLATWSVATDDIDGDVTRLNEGGAFLAEPLAGERVRPDGGVVRWRLSVPRELGPERPPFLIEHDPAAAEWTPDDRGRAGQRGPSDRRRRSTRDPGTADHRRCPARSRS